MLKVNIDQHNTDYVDYLVPFVLHVLATHRPDPVDAIGAQGLLEDEFGLHIPQKASELILRRLAKRKMIEKRDFAYHITPKLVAPDIAHKRETARKHQETVVTALRETGKAKHGLDWTEAKATDVMLAYLSHFAIECLQAYARHTALPTNVRASSQDIFVVHSFVRGIVNTPVFDSFMTLVKGHMLANALICDDLAAIPRKMSRLACFFDTPLMLRLLGLLDVPSQVAAQELVELLKGLGASVCVFEHTLDEMHRVLQWLEANLDNPRYQTKFLAAMREADTSVSDVFLIRNQLAKHCNDAGVTIRKTPDYQYDFQIDEELLQKSMEEEVRYSNPRAIAFDVNSIRSIYAEL